MHENILTRKFYTLKTPKYKKKIDYSLLFVKTMHLQTVRIKLTIWHNAIFLL